MGSMDDEILKEIERRRAVKEQEVTLEQGQTYAPKTAEGDVITEEAKEDNTGHRPKANEAKGKAIIVVIAVVAVIVAIVIVAGAVTKQKEEEPEEIEPPEWMSEEVEPSFTYTYDELEELRLAGYTGNEIEEYALLEMDAALLVQEAEQARKEQYDKEIAPYFDNASEEFKALWNNTWAGQPELVFDPDITQYGYYAETMNVDYERLPATGHQLFIKFYLENGDPLFMLVTPERYLTLKDSGNIVVRVSYTQTADGKRIVTQMQEVVQ